MMKYVIIILLLIQFTSAQQTGVISGRIIDENTHQPLTGVNVQVVDTELGTASDKNGNFYINDIPVGTRHVEVTMIGYEKRVFLNLPITSVRPVNLSIKLFVAPIELGEIEVPGKIFSKSSESIISSININQIEFRSDPGSAWDVQRTVQAFPSVTQVGDHLNEIISRGGSPGENLFIIDNIEIDNPNHFGIEGNGGGSFSIINPLFVKNVEFTPGAFSARYGDKSSSVMNITLEEGSSSKFELDIDVSMGGAGLTAEGPINKGKGSFIIGSTWSYLDKIVVNQGLTTIPYYENHQAKLVYNLNPKYKLIFNGLIANSDVFSEGEDLVKSYYGISSFEQKGKIIIGGLTLKTLLGELGYGLITLSYSQKTNQANIYDFGLEEYPWFIRDNIVNDLTLKTEWFLQTPIGEINTGFSLKRIDYDNNEWLNADIAFKYDTSYWIDNEWHLPDSLTQPEIVSPIYYRPTLTHDIFTKYGKFAYYIQNKIKIMEDWRLVSGIRLDYFTGTKDLVFSPRLNLQYTVNPANAFHIAYGRHYQYPEYFMVLKDSLNSHLKTKYTDQLVLGYEHFFDSDFRATLELYYKFYNNIYTHYYWSHKPENYPEHLNHTFHWENEGTRENYGLELLLHKKLSQNWHGILSYSWNHSLAKDVRTIKHVPNPDEYLNDGNWYPWDYDVRHNLTFIGGWKKKFSTYNWYQQLKNNTVFKILSPVMPIADEIEFSFRYSYTSGRPFTEKTYYPELYDWQYPDNINWNGTRYPDYKRLDLMLLKRHNLKKVNIVIYINFINIFNRDNVLNWVYNSNGTKETVLHFKTLPIGGVTIEL